MTKITARIGAARLALLTGLSVAVAAIAVLTTSMAPATTAASTNQLTVNAHESSGHVMLSWNHLDDAVNGYTIMRHVPNTPGERDFCKVYPRKPNQRLRHFDSATNGTNYEYRVIAQAAQGEITASPDALLTSEELLPPTNLKVKAKRNGATLEGVEVSFDNANFDASANSIATWYTIYRGNTAVAENISLANQTGGRLTYLDTTAQPNTTYTYSVNVSAGDEEPGFFGREDLMETASVNTGSVTESGATPQSASEETTTQLTVSARGSHSRVMLSWNYLDNPAVTGYKVMHREASGSQLIIHRTTSNQVTRFFATGANGTSYVFRVVAEVATGKVEATPDADVTSGKVLPPTNVTAKAKVDNREFKGVEIAFDNANLGAASGYGTSYIIDRSGVTLASEIQLADQTGGRLTYLDTTAQHDTSYTYSVNLTIHKNHVSTHGDDDLAESATVATPLPAPGNFAATVQNGNIKLSWDAPAGAINSYTILRNHVGDSGESMAQLAQDVRKGATSYTDRTTANGSAYKYRIRAMGAVRGLPSQDVAATVPEVPPDPSKLKLTIFEPDVSLWWLGEHNPDDEYPTYYDIDRKEPEDTEWERLATTTLPSYMDTSAGSEKTYRYRVTAWNAGGKNPNPLRERITTPEARFWRGTVTVGEGVQGGETWKGYTPFGGAFGSISLPQSVVSGEHTYAVELVVHTPGKVYLGMSRTVPQEFVLQLGDTKLSSARARTSKAPETYLYEWSNTRNGQQVLDWSDGDQVSVTLRSTEMAAAIPENTPATGRPTINGTPEAGNTLTVGTTSIADANGIDRAAFQYRWYTLSGNIPGATGTSYTLKDTDVGKTIWVKVQFTDLAQYLESVFSRGETVRAAATSSNDDDGEKREGKPGSP